MRVGQASPGRPPQPCTPHYGIAPSPTPCTPRGLAEAETAGLRPDCRTTGSALHRQRPPALCSQPCSPMCVPGLDTEQSLSQAAILVSEQPGGAPSCSWAAPLFLLIMGTRCMEIINSSVSLWYVRVVRAQHTLPRSGKAQQPGCTWGWGTACSSLAR